MKSKIWWTKSRAIPTMLVFLACLCAFTPKSWARYSGGTGEPNNPYQIATAEDLNDIGNYEEDWDKNFVLANDVNLAQYTGAQFNIIGKWFRWGDPNNKPFTGVFDGNDHKILNFTWTSDGIDCVGLFRYVGNNAHIKNLGLENVDVNAVNGNYVGGLVGSNEGTISACYATGTVAGGDNSQYIGGLCGVNWDRITDCYATGNVTGGNMSNYIGGLCGENRDRITDCYATGNVTGVVGSLCIGGLCGENGEDGTISNCYATGAVTAGLFLGGLCGENYYGTISNCYATGAVTRGVYLGGLCGKNDKGEISDCYATGTVTGGNNSQYIGGLCGLMSVYGTISDCYATGNVTGGDNSWYLGGLCGANWGGTISTCYATGNVTGGDNSRGLGGLCGWNDGTIVVCYATGIVAGVDNSWGLGGGLCGGDWGTISACFWDIQTSDCNTSAGGTGKTTAEMKIKSTFTDAGWDFVEIWGIGEHQTYPFLRFAPAGDFNYDKKIDLLDLAILASHWLEEK